MASGPGQTATCTSASTEAAAMASTSHVAKRRAVAASGSALAMTKRAREVQQTLAGVESLERDARRPAP